MSVSPTPSPPSPSDPTSERLAGHSALITGGGSGIGLGCARHLVRDGAAVVLAGRSPERLERGAAELREAFAGTGDVEVHTVVCDVTDEAAVAEACAVAAGVGRFTMVVANSGIGAASPFHLTTLEEWNGVLGTNLTGAFLTMKHSVPHLVRSGGGSIVAVSSIASPLTHRFMSAYCVSKAGLDMLVKQVADELGSSGIRCNSVRPGLVPTETTAGITATPMILEDYLEQMPLGRIGHDDDVAALARFLLGPDSAWITGQCIGVDGGHTLRRGPNLTPVMEMVLGDAVRPHA